MCGELNSATEQITSSGAASRSASQEIPCLLWNSKVYFCAQKNPLLIPIST